jgi:hypothetical protein
MLGPWIIQADLCGFMRGLNPVRWLRTGPHRLMRSHNLPHPTDNRFIVDDLTFALPASRSSTIDTSAQKYMTNHLFALHMK